MSRQLISANGDDKLVSMDGERAPISNAQSHTPALGHPAGFRELVGYRVLAWRADFAEIALDLGPQHKNRMGIVHGGVYMTILDAVMGHAATWCSVKGHTRRCVTVSLTTSFLSPARGGCIHAFGHLIGNENRIGTCRGEVRDACGALLMTAQGAFRYFPGSQHVEGVPRER
ncbi:MAG: PaaI family thioesterase [Pseudomonadota bacterium]